MISNPFMLGKPYNRVRSQKASVYQVSSQGYTLPPPPIPLGVPCIQDRSTLCKFLKALWRPKSKTGKLSSKWIYNCFQFTLHVGLSSQSIKTMKSDQAKLGRPATQLSVINNEQRLLLMWKHKSNQTRVFVIEFDIITNYIF